MDLESALSELGVPRGSSFQDVRRAYLRLLKTRKPEADPDGFLRLRAAFEAVQSLLGSPGAAPPGPPAGSAAARHWREAPPAAPVPLPGAVPQEDAAPPEDAAPLDGEETAAQGFQALLRRMATASDDELASASGAVSPPVVLSAASAWLARGRPIEAGRCLRRLFAACPTHLIPVGLVLATIVSLEEAGAVDEGVDFLRSADGCLTSSFREATAGGLDLGPVWLVLRELVAIDGEFPVELRSAIARAIRDGSLAAAEERLRLFAKQQSRAAERAAQLIADLPILRAAYHRILSPPPRRSWLHRPLPKLHPAGRLAWIAVVLLAQVIFVWRPYASDRRTVWEANEPVAMPAPATPSRAAAPPGPPAVDPPFFHAVCGGAKVPSTACLRGAALIHSARGGDCHGARAIWVEMTGAAVLGGDDAADFQRLRRRLEDLVASCK
jgi:hypothetical protein